MKNSFINILHFVLGYQRYLLYFTRIKIAFLKSDNRKHDFLFFEKTVGATANIIVIGANTGITTIPFAKKKPDRKIFAYEPLPSNFEVLERCVQLYNLPNINIYMIALGNETGHSEIILPILGGTKKHGLAHINSPSINSFGTGEKHPIQMAKLDNRTELQNIKINAVKLVAENYETEILKGAKDLIAKHKPFIYCELWPNENRKSTMKLLQEYGYKIYYREGEHLKDYKNSSYSGKNFFFKPHNV